MTKLAVIHLSDIHIHGNNDACLEKVQALASSCFPAAREADACLLAITGDVAFSGASVEYVVAKDRLVDPMVEILKRETSRPVYVSVVPGNHDCILKPVDEVRETIIKAIVEEPAKAESEPMVMLCTQAQKEFFKFADSIAVPKAERNSQLFWQQEFDVDGKRVRISSLNAAWMSRLPETQGQLVFPVSRFEDELAAPACIHLALVHHPFNWYSQSAYHQLRMRLRLSCTAVLSGHEHIGNVGKIEDQLSGTSLFFEAAALQPHEKNVDPGFSVYLFDLDHKQVAADSFALSVDGTRKSETAHIFNWSDENFIHGALDITPEFASYLSDAGGNFTHAAKERLTLEDIFVWPDLRDWEDADATKQKTFCAQELVTALERGEHVIISGDEKSGKTTLLFWYFRQLVAHGYAPVYLSGGDLNIKSPADPEKRIKKAISVQYKNPAAVEGMPREKKILLIDDVDRLKSGLQALPSLLHYAERHFSGVCTTAAAGFEVTNLADTATATALASFTSYDLMRFGLRLRHQLIKKWCSLSAVVTKTELDKRVDEVESIVNSVIGKQLVPEHPMYLLILLQSCEQHRHGEIQNSGLSYYYQYLITKSLGEVGVKPSELDEHFNYLSILAWRFRSLGAKELERGDLAIANKEFSDLFTTVDLAERLAMLTRARLLAKVGDCYSFSYPYVYYFFVGRYLAKNLGQIDIRAWIEDSCKKLYLRDRANAIMFLTHHVENDWVIDKICQVLRECFSEKKPIEFNGDTGFLNELVKRTSEITFSTPDVDENQVAVREYQDAVADDEPEQEESDYSLLSLTAKWNLLLKTAEILGLILKNHYGSLFRTRKQEMIREVFDGPLRALRLWLEEVSSELPQFVNDLKQHELLQNKRLEPAEAERRAKNRVFNLMGMVATSAIGASGAYIASEKLKEDISQAISDNPTNAYRLIGAASRLMKPGAVPMDMVKKLANDLEKNPYAFGVLQSLGFFHMYMFHTDETQKQALCSALKISFSAAKAIEIQKNTKLLN